MPYYRQLFLVLGAATFSIYCLVQAFRGIVLRSVESNPEAASIVAGNAALRVGETWLLVGLIAGGFAALWFWLTRRD